MPRTVKAPLCGLLLLALLLPAPAPAGAGDADLSRARRDYREARQALRQGQLARYQRLRARLDGYLLVAYLDYAYYKKRVAKTAPAVLARLIERHADTPVSRWLRKRWLRALAARGDWDRFMAVYRPIPGAADLACHHLERRRLAGAGWEALDADLDRLWRHGRPRPAVCERLFRRWHAAGGLKRDRVWARIRAAMRRGQLGLARRLARDYLDAEDRIWVTRWRRMHRRPRQALARIDFPLKRPVARMVVKHGLDRLARRDPELAMRTWERLRAAHPFDARDEQDVLRALGLRAAYRQLPVALDWLARVRPGPGDRELAAWRLRVALRAGDWTRVGTFLDQLDDGTRREAGWRYFRARYLEWAGRGGEARRLYRALARERDYYGFLAADRLGTPYRFAHRGVAVPGRLVRALAGQRGFRIARELFLIGELANARRQWRWATRALDARGLKAAAVLAHRWGWYDRAILTVSRAGHLDDLDLRFPVVYRELVEANARRARIDPGWVFGVMRQESAFIPDARSRAGALGLMQLMPRTGRLVARRLRLRPPSRRRLLEAPVNVRLGTHYLRAVLDRHGGHQALATAAYNAGPHRVRRWLPAKHPLDADLWVEAIPFDETRRYVKNVLAFAAVYDHRLGYPLKRLTDRMPPVPPRPASR